LSSEIITDSGEGDLEAERAAEEATERERRSCWFVLLGMDSMSRGIWITSFQWDFTTETEGEQEERRENMRVVINGTAKEIAALVVELQEQRELEKRRRLERIVSLNFTEDCANSQKK
jgi:hypothetical protein